MIHISYKILASKTHGIGLFADQGIKSGDLIYTPSPLLDVDLTPEQFQGLTVNEQREVMYYGYFNKYSGKYHVAFDAIRILNHGNADVANVTQDEEMVMTAKRDIQKGEELLQDYVEIYPDGSEHFDRINNLSTI
jgi:hypothetical protein